MASLPSRHSQAKEVEPSISQAPGWLFSVTGFCPCYLISASLSPRSHRMATGTRTICTEILPAPQFIHQTCHLSCNDLDHSTSSPKAGSDSKTQSSPASLQMGVRCPESTSWVSEYMRESGHREQHLWRCLCCVYWTINNWSSLPNHEEMGRMPNCPESRSHFITKHLKSVPCWVLKYWSTHKAVPLSPEFPFPLTSDFVTISGPFLSNTLLSYFYVLLHKQIYI